MSWHVRHNRSLHEHVLALTMTVVPVPRVDPDEQLTLKREGDHFWRAELKIGFMEHPDIPEEFSASCKAKGVHISPPTRTVWRISTAARSTEYADPRKGYAPDWGTAIYDFGRKEVADFLYASSLSNSGCV